MRSQSGGSSPKESRVGRDALDAPRRADRLEQPDHQPAAFLAVIAVRGRILEHGHVRRQPLDGLGEQVVVLGGLVRYVDTGERAELARPHARAVDDVLGRDIAERRPHAGDPSPRRQHTERRDALEDPDAPHARALGERHRDVDRIHAAVLLDVEAGLDVIDLGEREQLLHLARRDLVHVDAAVAVECRDAAVLLEAIAVRGDLDEADRRQARGLPGLGLEPAVQVASVLAHLGRGLGRRAEGHHQPGRVPRRAGGQIRSRSRRTMSFQPMRAR